MPTLALKPSSPLVRGYYASLRQLSLLHATHEGAVRVSFATLLHGCARKFNWSLVNK